MRVVNFGSLNIDYTYRVDAFVQPGETKAAQSLSVHCGGKGLNQSVALARAGAEVFHAGLVGADGAFLVEKLRQEGVDTRWVQQVEERSGHAIIQVDAAGQNCILLYPGTNHGLTEGYLDQVLGQFGPGDWVLLQNETNLVGTIIQKAADRGMQVAFNAAPMDAGVRDYPLERVRWLLVNETEGAALSGQEDPQAIVDTLRRRYPRTAVVLTLGEQGSLYAGEEGQFFCPAQRVQAVDTTAAGDTFTGFFLRAVGQGKNPSQALEEATAASVLAVTRPGAADSIPHWQELQGR